MRKAKRRKREERRGCITCNITFYSQLSLYQTPLLLSTPFPNMFNQQPLPKTGNMHMYACTRNPSPLVPAHTTLQSHSEIEEYFKTLHDHTHNINIRRVPAYRSCLDTDSHEEMLSKLQDLRELYHVGLLTSDDNTDEEN